jgi:hypothetical protein
MLIEREGITEEGGAWTVIRMPAINDAGESLWPERYSAEELGRRRGKMIPMIWNALYQQTPISAGTMFGGLQYGEFPAYDKRRMVQAWCDPGYSGTNYTALTIGTQKDDLVYLKGWAWRQNITELYDTIAIILAGHQCGTLFMDSTGDKGLAAEQMRKRWPATTERPEHMNKHAKIVSYLGGNWNNLRYDPGSMPEYIGQITGYAEGQEPDDAPDSAASLLREILPMGSESDLMARFAL